MHHWATRDRELKARFNEIDTNGNGVLDKAEVAELLRGMGKSEDEICEATANSLYFGAQAAVNMINGMSFDQFRGILLIINSESSIINY